MARNIPLLTQVRDLIQADASKLDMSLWASVPVDAVQLNGGITAKVSCGTTACVAGWTVQLAGDQLLVREDQVAESTDTYDVSESVAKNGRVCGIEDRARKLLGLTYEEAGDLFFLDYAEEVVEMLDRLIAGEDICDHVY